MYFNKDNGNNFYNTYNNIVVQYCTKTGGKPTSKTWRSQQRSVAENEEWNILTESCCGPTN